MNIGNIGERMSRVTIVWGNECPGWLINGGTIVPNNDKTCPSKFPIIKTYRTYRLLEVTLNKEI